MSDRVEDFSYVEGLQQGPRRRRGRLLDAARLAREDEDPSPYRDVQRWLATEPAATELQMFPAFGKKKTFRPLWSVLCFGNTLYVSMIPFLGNSVKWLDGQGCSGTWSSTLTPLRHEGFSPHRR